MSQSIEGEKPPEQDVERELIYKNFVLAQSLTSILNDPRVAVISTKDWTPDVVVQQPEDLPVVHYNDFATYIDSISSVYELFSQYRHLDGSSSHSTFISPASKHKSPQPEQQNTTLPRSTSGEFSLTRSASKRREEKSALTSVPNVFFQENFDLTDLDVFNAACAELQDPECSPLILQEKLSHYLDIVEVELVKQISTRSDSFFAALSTLQELHAEVSNTCNATIKFREQLQQYDNEIVKKFLEVTRKKHSKQKAHDILKKLKLMASVKQTQPTIQLLLSDNDFSGALDLISTTQEALSNELAGIIGFKHTHQQLKEMLVLIEKMMQADFLRAAPIGYAENTTNEYNHDVVLEAIDQLEPLLIGLIRIGKFHVCMQDYREDVLRSIKDIIRLTLDQELAVKDASRQGMDLNERIQQLPFDIYKGIMESVFGRLFSQLSRANALHKILLSVIARCLPQNMQEIVNDNNHTETYQETDTSRQRGNSANSLDISNEFISDNNALIENASMNPLPAIRPIVLEPESSGNLYEDLSQLVQDSFDSVCTFVDLAHVKCARLIQMRTDSNSRLSSQDFAQLVEVTMRFVQETEKLQNGKQCYPLRSTLFNQAKSFLESLHSNKMNSLALMLENETWVQVEVPSEFQEVVNKMIQEIDSKLPQKASSTEKTETVAENPTTDANMAPMNNYITIDGEHYCVVNSALMTIKMIREYLQLANQLPFLHTDVLQKFIELLQLFNSRTCQLVLGAGAMQIHKLKSITTKHLALASRSLGLQIAMLPHIRNALLPYFPSKQQLMLNDIDRVQKDYHNHQQEIAQKFVSIMRERTQVHCKTLRASEWKEELQAPTPPIAALTKETGTLHRVLAQVLPVEQVKQIFGNVCAMFDMKMKEILSNLTLTPQGKQRLLADIEYFRKTISILTDNTNELNELEEYFQSHYG